MADSTKIDLEDNSKYRVTLDLVARIALDEKGTKDRAYWLKLYAQCDRVVVAHWSAEEALKQT